MILRRRTASLLALLATASLAAPGSGGQAYRAGRVEVNYYHCDLDDSEQPFSVWLPRDYTPKKKWPLFIQLHGLGGSHKFGGAKREIEDCVVAAPDGRGATDYKLWGEIDVVRVVHEMKARYSIDPDRVYLFGGSMGGSGSWQVGVHYPDLFAALGPVCGNADHRVWEKLWQWAEKEPTALSPKKAWVEATESPAFFAENLINLPSYCIHGARDNVVPCGHSRSMVAELKRAGAPVIYVEDPDAGHGIGGHLQAPMLKWMKEQRRNPWPKRVVFKTAWRRHPAAYWVRLHRFERPFAFARIEAEVAAPGSIRVKTENLEEFSLHLVQPLVPAGKPVRVEIDGREHYSGPVPKDGWLRLRKQAQAWKPSKPPTGLAKTPTREGPIQHAFMSSFTIVYGTQGKDERAKRVCREEARIIADRWNRWARGRCRLKADRDVTPKDIETANLILVGDPATNSLVPRVVGKLPIRIEGNAVVFADKRFEGEDLGVKLIYPNPLNPKRYVALFTGTSWQGVYQIVGRFGNWFDWGILDGWHWYDFAVFDNRTHSPETYLAVGYFDNDWQLNPDWMVTGDEKLRLARPPRKVPGYRTAPAEAGEIYLSDLEPAHARIEKGCVGRDRSFNAYPLTLGGRTFTRGLGVHSNCDLAFDLGGRFGTFEAVVGADLEGEDHVSEARDRAESFEFMVIGDGRMIYKTGRMRWDSPPRHIYIPIGRVRRLELKVHRRSGPRWLSGPIDWAIARVGEPISNRVAVRSKFDKPQRLVDVQSLDGSWRLASYGVGEGIAHDAHRANAEAWRNGLDAAVPSSVFAALEAAGQGHLPKPDALAREWWYRRSFEAPAEWAGRSVWLELDGAAYIADCWLNGRWIGRTAGPFATGRIDATLGLLPGKRNDLAVRVVAAPADWAKGDQVSTPARQLVTAQGLADSGYPPLGLWRSVRAKAAGPCLLRHVNVQTLELSAEAARLRVTADLVSVVKDKLAVVLAGSIAGDGFETKPATFEQKANVDGHKTAAVAFELALAKPKLWWPRELGEQPLYRLAAALKLAGGSVSDESSVRFGVRTVDLDTSHRTARLRINGQKTLDVRGVVWTPADALLRLDARRYERLLAYASDCRFNVLRVWGGGLAETDLFYDLCDRRGLLVLQEFPLASDAQQRIADQFLASARDTIVRLRPHPSLAAWCVGGGVRGNEPPEPRLAAALAGLCDQLDPGRRCVLESPRTGLARIWTTRADAATRRTYWRATSLPYTPGLASPSTHAALRGWLGRELPWPANAAWAGASARSPAVAAYGRSPSAREHILKAQAAQAAAVQRAVERLRITGASHVLWQLGEPLPSASGALIDASGRPKPAFYAFQRSMGRVAIFADFGQAAPTTLVPGDALRGEVCIHAAQAALRGVVASATVLDRSMRQRASWRRRLDVPRGATVRPLLFHWRPDRSLVGDVCFLRLGLADKAGRAVASNLYWFAVVAPERAPTTPRLKVAWLTDRPRGPLADQAFLAATGIQVVRPKATELSTTALGTEAEEEEEVEPVAAASFESVDAVVVDAATVFDVYGDQDLKAVAAAVAKGTGLFIAGLNDEVRNSAVGPLIPLGTPAARPTGIPRRPVAADPTHPALRGVSFATCPALSRRPALPLKSDAAVLAELGPGHPFLVEAAHGRGRVLVLALQPGDSLVGWPDARRFHAAFLGYLGRLPHHKFASLLEAAEATPLQALDRLGHTSVQAAIRQQGDTVAVRITNTSATLAFMVHLETVPKEPAKAPAQPVLDLSDNYLSLLPGETRTIRIDVDKRGLPPDAKLPRQTFVLVLRGWNLPPQPLEGQLTLDEGRVRWH